MLRLRRGLSQAALGKRCNVSQKEISHYETNYRRPPADIMPMLAEALGTTIDTLYGAEIDAGRSHGGELRKTTIWLIAEKLEKLDEPERLEVLGLIDRILTGKNPDHDRVEGRT